MQDRTIFILKLLIVSTLFSYLVKYGGRQLSIAPSTTHAAIAVLILPLLMSLLLGWRWFKASQQ